MRIAVLTSGGDAPGMNAAIQSVVKSAAGRGHEALGVRRGYEGLLEGDFIPLSLLDVDDVARRGGTFLGSARSRRFPTEDGQKQSRAKLREHRIDALIVVGGNGSLAGAEALAEQPPCLVLGLPASIDNDVGHSGMAIGVDTAVNTIVEACDRISDTAGSHQRAFVVEVMGRHCGYLAMRAGIAAGADAILYAEKKVAEDVLIEKLSALLLRSFSPPRSKARVLILKAEGVHVPTSTLVARLNAMATPEAAFDVRETILGHVVRGGSPSATDRVIAQRLGLAAVLAAEEGVHGEMLGWEMRPDVGTATADPSIRRIALSEVRTESARLIDGTSPIVRRRLALLEQVEGLLAL